jgi:hypothetical protein
MGGSQWVRKSMQVGTPNRRITPRVLSFKACDIIVGGGGGGVPLVLSCMQFNCMQLICVVYLSSR